MIGLAISLLWWGICEGQSGTEQERAGEPPDHAAGLLPVKGEREGRFGWEEPPNAAQFQGSFVRADGESSGQLPSGGAPYLIRRASWSHHAQPLTGAAPRKHSLGGGNCGSGQLCSLQQETWAACCHSCHRPDVNVGCQTGQHSFSVWLVVQQNSRPWSIPLLLVVNDRLQRSAYCWLWLTDCIVLCMTHLFLRDNKSESAPKVSECESLNSEARMGLALLEKCS